MFEFKFETWVLQYTKIFWVFCTKGKTRFAWQGSVMLRPQSVESEWRCRDYSFTTKIFDCSILKFYYIPLILKNANMINLDFGE